MAIKTATFGKPQETIFLSLHSGPYLHFEHQFANMQEAGNFITMKYVMHGPWYLNRHSILLTTAEGDAISTLQGGDILSFFQIPVSAFVA